MKLMKEILFIGLLLGDPLLALAKDCTNLIPGIGRMARGVDITSLDLFPSDLLQSNGFRHALFEFTCDSELLWAHPTNPDVHYSLPDQIGAINTVPGGALNTKTSFHRDVESFKKSLNIQIGIDISTALSELGSFSLSVGYQSAQEQILKSNKSVSIAAAYISAVQIDFKASNAMRLNENFLGYLNILPERYEDNIELYDEFVQTFGTHYFESAMFGGYLHQETLIENDYFYQTNMKEINVNVKLAFLVKGVKAGINVNVGVASNSSIEKFNSNSEISFFYYGGLTDLSDQADLAYLTKWFNSVNKDPWLFGGQLKPIENLIQNSTIKAEVKKAVLFKRTKAYLEEFKNHIYLTGFQLSDSENRNLTEIENFFQDPTYQEFEIEDIGLIIHDFFLSIQNLRDKANLADLFNKLQAMENEILSCKYYIFVDYCPQTTLLHEVSQQKQKSGAIINKIYSIINNEVFIEHREIQNLIQDGNVMLQYQRTAVLDACEDNSGCLTCLQGAVDWVISYQPSCNNLNLYSIVKCKPNQSNCT